MEVAPAALRLDRYVLGQLVRRADAEVLVAPDGTGLTGSELTALVHGIARRLGDIGVRPGDRVASAARTHPDVIATCLAANLVGAAFAPLAHVATTTELLAAAAALEPSAILVDATTAERAAPTGVPQFRVGTSARVPDGALSPALPLVRELDPSVVRLSSGTTTGTPRPLVLSHRSMVLTLVGEALEIRVGSDDRVVVAMPLQGAGTWFSLACLAVGAHVTMHPRPSALVPEDLAGATHLVAVPEVLKGLAATNGSLAGLRIASTAAPLAQPDRAALVARGAAIHDLYGSTETEMLSSRRPGEPVAYPFFWAEVDTSSESGVLLKRGPDVYSGLWTGEATAPPVDAEPTWVASGDVGAVAADGGVSVAGRVDDVLLVRGNNVQPGEVEQVIAAVGDIADVAVGREPGPGGGDRLVAYVVTRDEAALDAARVACAEHLAPYKRPDSWVVVDAVPRNHFGKLERRLLGKQRNGGKR